jgi:uncharacterized protein YjbI with pentapeptide repeats
LRYANFDQADIRHALFYDVDMLGASFSGSQSTGAKRGGSPTIEDNGDIPAGSEAPAAV